MTQLANCMKARTKDKSDCDVAIKDCDDSKKKLGLCMVRSFPVISIYLYYVILNDFMNCTQIIQMYNPWNCTNLVINIIKYESFISRQERRNVMVI